MDALRLDDPLLRRPRFPEVAKTSGPSADEVFDAVVAEWRTRPLAEAMRAGAVKRFGGS